MGPSARWVDDLVARSVDDSVARSVDDLFARQVDDLVSRLGGVLLGLWTAACLWLGVLRGPPVSFATASVPCRLCHCMTALQYWRVARAFSDIKLSVSSLLLPPRS